MNLSKEKPEPVEEQSSNNFVDYKVVHHFVDSPVEFRVLEKKVMKLINQGYEPWGDLVLQHEPSGGHTDACQVMVKYREAC